MHDDTQKYDIFSCSLYDFKYAYIDTVKFQMFFPWFNPNGDR